MLHSAYLRLVAFILILIVFALMGALMFTCLKVFVMALSTVFAALGGG